MKATELVLTRRRFSPHSTIGELTVDGKWQCYILEDVVRPPGVKIHGQTAIPYGRYQVIINQSQRFGRRMPLLLRVPGFEGVRIHAGNTAADTDGCLLTGSFVGEHGDAVERSRAAFDLLMPLLEHACAVGEVWLEIIPGEGEPV